MTREVALPPVAELVPHSGPMLLLERVVEHSAERTVCEVRIARSGLFQRRDGHVPAWVAIEYMAQCIAAHAGMLARAQGQAVRPGLFVGSRRVVFRAAYFDRDLRLHVAARYAGSAGPLHAFDCDVRPVSEDVVLAEGRLHVYVGENIESNVGGYGRGE